MSGQMSSYDTSIRETKTWYRNLAIKFLTGTSLVNTWVIYNKFTGEKFKFLWFKEKFVTNLIMIR